MAGPLRRLRVLARIVAASVTACVAPHATSAGWASAVDSMRVSASSMSVSVAGGEVTLIDPLGRANRGGGAPLSQIPNCSRIEGPTRGVHTQEEAQAPRVELDLLSPRPGTYRLAVQAKSRVLLVQVSGECGGVRCGGADHLLGKVGKTYVWVVRWGVNAPDGKCALTLERATKHKPVRGATRPN